MKKLWVLEAGGVSLPFDLPCDAKAAQSRGASAKPLSDVSDAVRRGVELLEGKDGGGGPLNRNNHSN